MWNSDHGGAGGRRVNDYGFWNCGKCGLDEVCGNSYENDLSLDLIALAKSVGALGSNEGWLIGQCILPTRHRTL